MNYKIKYLIAIISVIYMTLNILIGNAISNKKTPFTNEDSDFSSNSLCKMLNIKDTNNIAEEYIKIERDNYFKECDNFNELDFVIIQDVLCSNSNSNSICKSFGSNTNIYSMTINIKDLLKIYNTVKEENIFCKADLFDKVFNISESDIEIIKSHEFLKKNNYTVYTDLHGSYHVSCSQFGKDTTKKPLQEDYFYIFPYQMPKLIYERKMIEEKNKRKKLTLDYLNKNNNDKMNVFIFKIDSISYEHFKRS
jgi:hypothetical protein